MRERTLLIGITIIILSWIGNVLYFQSKQLTQPIFLDHYYETYMQDGQFLEFFYLSNKYEPLEVSRVVVDNVALYPTDSGYWGMHQAFTSAYIVNEYMHHNLMSVTLQLPSEGLPIIKGSNDVWSFNQLEVTFTNGQTIVADIGKVAIYGKYPDTGEFDFRYSSGSTDHSHEQVSNATESLQVDSIQIPFAEDIAQHVSLKVGFYSKKFNELQEKEKSNHVSTVVVEDYDLQLNEDGFAWNEKIFPLQLEKNEWIKISSFFNSNRREYFQFNIKIQSTNTNGKPFEYWIPVTDYPYLTQQDVNELILEKSGGQVQ